MTTRKRLAAAGVGLLLVAGAYAAGRFTAPDKVREVKTTQTVEVESSQAKADIASLRAQLAETKKAIHRVRVSVVQPDGTRRTETKTDVAVDTTIRTEEVATAKAEESAQKAAESAVSAAKDVERHRPAVRVGGLLGGLYDGSLKPVGGAHIEGRIAGPFSVGAWGIGGSGVVGGGISLSLEF